MIAILFVWTVHTPSENLCAYLNINVTEKWVIKMCYSHDDKDRGITRCVCSSS